MSTRNIIVVTYFVNSDERYLMNDAASLIVVDGFRLGSELTKYLEMNDELLSS